ncbi:hypothetical protein H9L25_00735 [Terrisporobacter mayombei]|nr:hypothetical protein [Terrisporobacter mayombei]
MRRSIIIPSDINKEDRTLYLMKELGDREVIRQTIYSNLSGKSTEEIIEKCGWLSLACGIHDKELTLKYIKDIIKIGDYGTRLGDNQLQ